MFRDRWECSHIGTVIFVVQAALLVPYIVIGVMGGGTALGAISQGAIPYWVGCAVVALVVMGYVCLRRHEGHGAGQRGADDDVPAGRDDGVSGDRVRHGRLQPDRSPTCSRRRRRRRC